MREPGLHFFSYHPFYKLFSHVILKEKQEEGMFGRLLLNFYLLDSVLDSPSRLDEEHRLIARYAARLAAEAGNLVSE